MMKNRTIYPIVYYLNYPHMLLTPSLLENLYQLLCSMVAHSVLLFRVCSRFNKEVSKLVDGQLRKRRGIRYSIQDFFLVRFVEMV